MGAVGRFDRQVVLALVGITAMTAGWNVLEVVERVWIHRNGTDVSVGGRGDYAVGSRSLSRQGLAETLKHG